MYAVIKTGGKQYRVTHGEELTVEKLAADAGDMIQFNDVLMLGGKEPRIGAPYLDDAGVTAEVVAQIRGPKTLSFKKRRRKHSSKRLKGHRQDLTTVKIVDILDTGAGASGIKAALGARSAPKAETAGGGHDAATGAEAAAAKPAPKKAEPAAAPEPEKAVEMVEPANLLSAPEGEPDDLTRITGVGPKLRDKLNEAGVYHFWQIAAWGPAEVAHMDDMLSFKGRIERDDWIRQATDFAAESK